MTLDKLPNVADCVAYHVAISEFCRHPQNHLGHFIAWKPGDERPHALPPDRVEGFYSNLRAHAERLAPWVRKTLEQANRQADAARRLEAIEKDVEAEVRDRMELARGRLLSELERRYWLDVHPDKLDRNSPEENAAVLRWKKIAGELVEELVQ